MVVDLPKSGQPLIQFKGLAQMRKDLRKLDKQYQKDLDKELRNAARPIIADAKKRYRTIHPRSRKGHGSQRGLRAGARRGQPTVNIGTAKIPYLQGQEWGSKQYPQFPLWRKSPSGKGAVGRFFWPAVQDGMQEASRHVAAAVDRANKRAFPGV